MYTNTTKTKVFLRRKNNEEIRTRAGDITRIDIQIISHSNIRVVVSFYQVETSN